MRFVNKYSVAIMILLALGLALFLRIVVPYPLIFTESGVRFAEADPYSHMRLVDNTLAHFPTRTPFDPYTYYPEGAPVYYPPLFTLFLSGFIWLFSLGAPTAASTDILGALFPAVLGSLMVIPVFFIGRALFNKWVGVLAALLIAIMPGEVLGRTMLGFTDHHVVEILFTTIAMCFLILAVKSACDLRLTLKPFDWSPMRRPLLYSVLAGLFFGLYLQMWAGGPVFVLILLLYFAVQSIIDHVKNRGQDYLVITTTVMMVTSAAIVLPFLPRHYSPPLYFIALGVATLAPAVLYGLSRLTGRRGVPRVIYPVCWVFLLFSVATVFYIVKPDLFRSLLDNFAIFNPSALEQTIGEVDPLLFPSGSFSLSIAWLNFTTGFFFAPVALGILAWQLRKQNAPGIVLLIIWSVSTFGLTLAQRRFAYYYAIDVALLTACLSWMVMKWAGLKETFGQPVKEWRKQFRGRPAREIVRYKATMGLALATVFLLAIVPNFPPALKTVKQVPFAPEAAWEQTLTWLRENSPQPFGANDLYYEIVEKTNSGLNYEYPESAYGVMAWWDYGHWITRIAHRIPNHAPGGGRSAKVAECLLSQNEETAREYTQKLDSLYLIADYTTVIYKFHAVCEWAGTRREDYFDIYYQEQDGALIPIFLFYPEFYQTLLARLYCFEGKAVTPESTTVITYLEKQANGSAYKQVTGVRKFDTVEYAQAYFASQPGKNMRIVGADPFISPVPLDGLEHYRLVYRSASSSAPGNNKHATPVKTFIYIDDTRSISSSPVAEDDNS